MGTTTIVAKGNFLKSKQIGLLGVLVSTLAIYFIVSQINITALGESLVQARYIYVIPAVLLLVLGLVTRAARWRALLSGALPLARSFSIMNVSYLVNGILPLRIGELARVYLAARYEPSVPMLRTASTIIVERLLDLLAVLILLGVALTAGSVPAELRAAAAVAVPVVIAGFLLLIFFSRQRNLAHRLSARFFPPERLVGQRISQWLDHFLDGLIPLTQPRALLQTFFWTALSWGFSTAAGYILMFAFYEEGSWAVACLYIAAASFAIAVPAVPGNLGSYELSILLALSASGYGEPRNTAAAFALVVHGVNLGLYAVVGLIGFVQEGISFGQLSRNVREMRQNYAVTQDIGSRE
jgi:uncharacterized protein (TIRG00374 family)